MKFSLNLNYHASFVPVGVALLYPDWSLIGQNLAIPQEKQILNGKMCQVL